METFAIRVIDALLWFTAGMTFMARMYCAKYNITGADYIGWDTAAVIVGTLAGIRFFVWLDPAFRGK